MGVQYFIDKFKGLHGDPMTGQLSASEFKAYVKGRIWDEKTNTLILKNKNKQRFEGLDEYVTELRENYNDSEILDILLDKIKDVETNYSVTSTL